MSERRRAAPLRCRRTPKSWCSRGSLAACAFVRRTSAEPAEIEQHHHGQRREQQRDELRGGKRPDRAALVAAVELDDVPRDRVEQHVQPERPSRELASGFLGGEKNIKKKKL